MCSLVCMLFSFPFCPFSFTATGVGTNSAPNALGQGASNHLSLSPNPPLRPSAPPAVQVTPATPSVDKKQARVLYDYDAADNSELNLLADEVADFSLFEPQPGKMYLTTYYSRVISI